MLELEEGNAALLETVVLGLAAVALRDTPVVEERPDETPDTTLPLFLTTRFVVVLRAVTPILSAATLVSAATPLPRGLGACSAKADETQAHKNVVKTNILL